MPTLLSRSLVEPCGICGWHIQLMRQLGRNDWCGFRIRDARASDGPLCDQVWTLQCEFLPSWQE